MFAAVELIHGGFKRFSRTTSSPRRPHIDKPTTKRAVTFALTTRQMATARGTSTGELRTNLVPFVGLNKYKYVMLPVHTARHHASAPSKMRRGFWKMVWTWFVATSWTAASKPNRSAGAPQAGNP